MMKRYDGKKFSEKLDLVLNEITSGPNFREEQKGQFIHNFKRFKSEMKSKWLSTNSTEQYFLKKYGDWLQGTITIPVKNIKSAGRPEKSFEELSDRSKRRKTECLRSSNETQELLYAGQMLLREEGNVTGANVVKDILTSPEESAKYNAVFRKSDTSSDGKQLTPTQALSVFIEASLTRQQYEIIQKAAKDRFPCYSVIQKAKKYCYPPQESYRVTQTCAEIELKELVNHTVRRLMMYLEDVLVHLTDEELSSLELIYKWGCDGSQQAQYKQKFENSNDSDANIFQSSL